MIWLDLVIVGVLLLGLGIGAKRGFLQTLGGVAAMIVSFAGAGIAAGAFSGTVANGYALYWRKSWKVRESPAAAPPKWWSRRASLATPPAALPTAWALW